MSSTGYAEFCWHTSQFFVHQNQGICRVLAISRDDENSLEVLTTLDATDQPHADRLVRGLNVLANEHDDGPLAEVLSDLPQPAQLEVRTFIQNRNTPSAPGTYSEAYGPLCRVRCIFTTNDDDARDWLSAAYLIGLGVRATNEMTHDGIVGWTIELLNAEPSFASLDDLRAWSESDRTPVESTWTSDGQGHPIEQAWSVAQQASRSGHMVRLHTCELRNASKAAVDVFDAPIPASRDD